MALGERSRAALEVNNKSVCGSRHDLFVVVATASVQNHFVPEQSVGAHAGRLDTRFREP